MVHPMEFTGEVEDTEPNHHDEDSLEDDASIGDERREASTNNNDDDDRNQLEACRIYCSSFEAMELSFCLLLLITGLLLDFIAIKPRQRPIPFQLLEEPSSSSTQAYYVINQMYGELLEREIVSDGEVVLYGAILPFLCQIMLGYFSDSFNPHRTFCVYLAGIGLTLILTDVIKVYVGYLRPIFYDLCVPDDEYQTCTSGDDENDEARLSFPSGHSSLAFCGLGLFSSYLEQRFGVSKFREQQARGGQHSIVPSSETDHHHNRSDHHHPIRLSRIYSILSKAPLLLAGFIATSRIVDNHHFPADVVGGAVLGFSIALWIHNIWSVE